MNLGSLLDGAYCLFCCYVFTVMLYKLCELFCVLLWPVNELQDCGAACCYITAFMD